MIFKVWDVGESEDDANPTGRSSVADDRFRELIMGVLRSKRIEDMVQQEQDIKQPRRQKGKNWRCSLHRVGPYEENRFVQIRLGGENNNGFGVMPRASEYFLYEAEECEVNEAGVKLPMKIDTGDEGHVANFIQMGLRAGEYVVVKADWDPVLLRVGMFVSRVDSSEGNDIVAENGGKAEDVVG